MKKQQFYRTESAIYMLTHLCTCIHTILLMQELTFSIKDDCSCDEESGFGALSVLPEGYCDPVAEDPFWEPASVEDELKEQLQDMILPEENLT